MGDTGHPAESIEPYRNAIALREEMSGDEPHHVRWHADCAGSWHRLGEALEKLGRLVEAVEACQKSVAHQREVCAREPGEIKHRKFLDERLRQLFRLRLALGRRGEAVETARQRKALSPDDPAVALDVAGELAAASVLLRPGESVLAAARDKERHRYAVEAVAALRDAAKIGGRNPKLTAARSGSSSRPLANALQ